MRPFWLKNTDKIIHPTCSIYFVSVPCFPIIGFVFYLNLKKNGRAKVGIYQLKKEWI
jgi:hypothetical protein